MYFQIWQDSIKRFDESFLWNFLFVQPYDLHSVFFTCFIFLYTEYHTLNCLYFFLPTQ